MNLSSHCSTGFFEEKFKLQYVKGDILIHIATQNLIWHFCQSGTLCGNVNMEVFPNIWNKNAFGTTSLYALVVHKQFQRRELYNWICSTIKFKLENWWYSYFSNDFESLVKLGLFRSSYFGSKRFLVLLILCFLCCAYVRIPHNYLILPVRQWKLCILKQQFVRPKITLSMELQVLTNFDTHWLNYRTYHNGIS